MRKDETEKRILIAYCLVFIVVGVVSFFLGIAMGIIEGVFLGIIFIIASYFLNEVSK